MKPKAAIAALTLTLLTGCGGRDRWTIDDPSFYPVAIDYWRDDRSFLVGSYEHGGIARISSEGVSDVRPFIANRLAIDGRKKALRLTIDSARDRLWVLDTDRVYVYSLHTRELLTRLDLPRASRASGSSCLPDMTFNPYTGALYIADGREQKLYEIYEESTTEALVKTELRLRRDDGKPLGLISALAVIAEPHALIAGSAETGAVYRIDPVTGHTRQIAVANPELLKGICALKPVGDATLTVWRSSPAPRQFYFTSMSSKSLYGLSLYPDLDRAQAVTVTRMQTLESPIAIAPAGGFVIATSSQLGSHHDLGGSGNPLAPFKLIAIPAPLGPFAADSVSRRPLP